MLQTLIFPRGKYKNTTQLWTTTGEKKPPPCPNCPKSKCPNCPKYVCRKTFKSLGWSWPSSLWALGPPKEEEGQVSSQTFWTEISLDADNPIIPGCGKKTHFLPNILRGKNDPQAMGGILVDFELFGQTGRFFLYPRVPPCRANFLSIRPRIKFFI